MRFSTGADRDSIGWSSRSSDRDGERFQDDGHGTVLLVTIEAPGAPPRIEPIPTGRLSWQIDQRDMTAQPLGDLIADYSRRADPERTILRLTLSGIVEPRGYARIGELEQIVRNRFHAGSTLDAEAVLIEPSPEQLAEAVGVGVLSRVLEKLKEEARSPDAAARVVADHALKLLYRIAMEEQPT